MAEPREDPEKLHLEVPKWKISLLPKTHCRVLPGFSAYTESWLLVVYTVRIAYAL